MCRASLFTLSALLCFWLGFSSQGQPAPLAAAMKSTETTAAPAVRSAAASARIPDVRPIAAPLPSTAVPFSPHYTGATVSSTETAMIVGAQTFDVSATLTPAAIIRLTSPPQTVALQPVTLGDVVRLTLERNLDYKIAQINYQIAQDEVKGQWGIFDPLLTASVEIRDVTQQGSIFSALSGGAGGGLTGSRQSLAVPSLFEPNVPDVARQQEDDIRRLQDDVRRLQDELTSLTSLVAGAAGGFQSDYRSINRMKTRTGSVQVTQENGLGGQIGIGASLSRNWMTPTFLNINPSYSEAASIWMVQPLPFFRNWGPTVTMAGIHLAEKDEQSRDWSKRQELINQMASVTSGYWDLVATIYLAEVQRLSLESARNLLRINEIRLKNEVGTEIDVWEARAGAAQRENSLILASHSIGLAQDNLARITRINETPDWKIRMIPRDVPQYTEYAVDEQKSIAEAIERRPDMQQARLMKERAEIRRQVARNQRMPGFNAFGSYGITGLGPDTGRAGHNLGTADYDNWSLGLDFSVPIPNTRARATARQADKLIQGSELLTDKIKDLAVFEVRKAVRDLQSARSSIDVSKTQVRAEQEKLRGEMKRYEVGMATSQDLLDYQDRLAAAQNTLIVALVAYNKAIIDLERARGSLLESLKIDIGPTAPAPAAPTPTATP